MPKYFYQNYLEMRFSFLFKRLLFKTVLGSFFAIQRRGKEPTEHCPEVILNNFTTRLGHSIARMFAALFPQDPQFVGRQVATFHNQRDFIFFRFHRYRNLLLIKNSVDEWVTRMSF